MCTISAMSLILNSGSLRLAWMISCSRTMKSVSTEEVATVLASTSGFFEKASLSICRLLMRLAITDSR